MEVWDKATSVGGRASTSRVGDGGQADLGMQYVVFIIDNNLLFQSEFVLRLSMCCFISPLWNSSYECASSPQCCGPVRMDVESPLLPSMCQNLACTSSRILAI